MKIVHLPAPVAVENQAQNRSELRLPEFGHSSNLSFRKSHRITDTDREIENAFGIYLSKANSGELSAEEAMNQANAEIAKILERGK